MTTNPREPNPPAEKITKFNAYICSPTFLLLPALLAWLRTSGTVLGLYSERFRGFSKLLLDEDLRRASVRLGTYASLGLIGAELLGCVALLGYGSMPGGLIFMVGAISYISYLNYLCLRLIESKQRLREEGEAKDFENEVSRKYIRPKDILGKRTISSLNLF